MPRTVTVELSEEHARWIDDRIAAGDYPDEASAVRDGLDELVMAELTGSDSAPLTNQDVAEAVRPAYDRMLAGTAHYLTAEEVFGGVSERYRAWKKAQ